jgi:1,4-dihydroxy-2-naphthoate polyprenyltransferase
MFWRKSFADGTSSKRALLGRWTAGEGMTVGKLRAWYQASRPPFFVATLIPLLLGGAAAHAEGGWDTTRWLVVLLASFLVHLATNLANDYFEYSTGADDGESIGGSRVLQQGKISASEIRNALIILYAAALLCGIWIVRVSGVWWLPLVMLFAFFSSLFYTAPPVRYGYRGLGEVFVGLNMGPVMVAGTAAALTGHFMPSALWLSLPIGLMVALILYYQSLSDIEADRAAGKLTIAARLGRTRAIWGFRLFVFATLLTIVLLVLRRSLHPLALASIISIAPAYKVDRMISRTPDWKDLHDRGGPVRMFYLVTGAILIFTVMIFG